jgi:peptidoglycan L-alanyl-D-glutamate endopeptidase CwlK
VSRLSTCDRRLQLLIYRAAATWRGDFTVVCGYRSPEEQEAAFAGGKSKKRGGESAHNLQPSQAVDIAPWDTEQQVILWDDAFAFAALREHVEATARALETPIRAAIGWDMGHVELR